MEIEANRNTNSAADGCRLPDSRRSNPRRLVICEQTGRWAVALRRELSSPGKLPEECPIEETRSVAQCWKRLEEAPAGFVVVELTPKNFQRLLVRMGYMEWRFPLARVAVVTRADAVDGKCLFRHERLFRQAGAVFFGTSLRSNLRSEEPLGVRDLADIVCRHLQQSPRPERTIREDIRARLPWKGLVT